MKKSKTKSIMIRLMIIGGVIIMGLFGLGALAPYREIDEEKSFVTAKINEIQIDMTSIPVHVIKTKAGNDIKFHIYGKSKRGIELASEMANRTVVVQAKRKLDGLPLEDVCLDVYIPENYEKDLFIKTTSGIIKVDPIHLATITCHTSSGGLEAEKLTAEKMTVDTTSGKINIKEVDTKELKISGSSSEVSLAYRELNNNRLDIATTSGNIIVNLPDTAQFSFKVVTNGKFKSDFPINTTDNTSKINLKGQIGNNSSKVLLQASSGSITIIKE